MSGLRRTLSAILSRIAPAPSPRLGSALAARLAATPLTIVDVGAAMGVDDRWAALGEDGCRFITFEPDERSRITETARTLAFPTALGSKKERRTLYLTKGPFASSLLSHNHALLKRFGTYPWHEPAGEVDLTIDRLDNLLKTRASWRPDFIKTDVEGADLDVLRGAERTLKGCLGVQAEVAFIERHLGTPFFSDIDAFLRARGFALFELSREHWIRNNGLFGPGARPQIVWGDAVYFRDLPEFTKTLSALKAVDEREALVLRFVALLMAYGAYDYACEVVEATRGQVGSGLAHDLQTAISNSARGPALFMLRGVIAAAIAGVLYVLSLPLGSRARTAFAAILAEQTEPLLRHIYRVTQRAGLANSCVGEPL